MRTPPKKEETGAIGIGTLIIFIALILVAAIAAAVIIKTAEELEEQGEKVSGDAQKLVSSTPHITIAEGGVSANTINMIYLYIDLYGSDAVDMRTVVLHILATPNGGNAASDDLIFNSVLSTQSTSECYGTEEIVDFNGQYNPNSNPATYLLGERARLKLTINLGITTGNPLPPDSSIEIWVHTTSSGHQTYDYYETPSEYPSGGVVKLEA
jgi:archaellin